MPRCRVPLLTLLAFALSACGPSGGAGQPSEDGPPPVQHDAAPAEAALATDGPVTPPQVPVKLGFLVQPTATGAGAAITPAVRVAVQDADGDTVTTATDTITLDLTGGPNGATLGGVRTAAAVGGVASFGDLTVDRAGAGYVLLASASGLGGAASAAFEVGAGAAAMLAFTAGPTAAVAGQTLTPVVVEILDAHGARVTSATTPVTLALGENPGGGALGGTTTVTAAGGVATFGDLSIDRAASGYTLAASAAGLPGVSSAVFDVSPGATARLALGGIGSAVTAGAAQTVIVTAQDALGNPTPAYTGTVRFSSSDPAAVLPADLTFAAGDAGTRTLTGGVTLVTAGQRTVTVTDTAAAAITGSSSALVSAAAATKLVFTTPPAATQVNAPITPAVVVAAQDPFGNVDAAVTAAVTLGFDAAPAGAHLGGTTTATAAAGVATFPGLHCDVALGGYRLRAHAGALTDAVSEPFDVWAAPAAGDLIVTEVMHTPSDHAAAKQWLEVRNVSGKLLELGGLAVTDTAPATPLGFIVAGSARVAPGGWFLFGAAADPYGGGQVVPGYVWPGSFALAETAGTLVLRAGSVTIDTFAYGAGWPALAGHAMTLSNTVAARGADQHRWYWCDATTAIAGTADFGTPGAANDDCGLGPEPAVVGWCAIEFPDDVPQSGLWPLSPSLTQAVSGRLRQAGVTDVNQAGNDDDPFLVAALGFGASADPATWTWIPAGYDAAWQSGAAGFAATDDLVTAGLAIATPGSYRYGYRVGLVDPVTSAVTAWQYCGRTGPVAAGDQTAWADFGTATVLPPCAPSQVVISQVYGGGSTTSPTPSFKCDFVELHNRGVNPVSLAGWSLLYGAASNTTWSSAWGGQYVFPPGAVIAGGGYYLVSGACGTVGADLPAADGAGGLSMAAAAGKVALIAGTTLPAACGNTAALVDLVGYGAGTQCWSGAGPTATLTNTTAAVRSAAACADTPDNAADFTIQTPAPRTSQTPPNHCDCGS